MAAVTRRNHALWLGPSTVTAGVLSYFMVFSLYPVLRDFPWVNLPLVLLGVTISIVGLRRAWVRPPLYRGKVGGTFGLLFSGTLGALFFAYVFVMSYGLPGPSATTRALTHAPEIALLDHTGKRFDLANQRGRKLLIVFYRGYW